VINKKIDKKALAHILSFKYGPDLLGVITGLKPSARCVIKENEAGSFVDFCDRYNLKYTFSDYRYNILQNQVLAKNKASNILIIYISKGSTLCEKLKYFDEIDEKITGRLLGYPDCCIEFYLDLVKNKNRQNIDFVRETNANTEKKMDFRLNNLREWCSGLQIDYSLVDFFPCSYDCKKALKYAKNIFGYIEKIDKKQANSIKKQLTKPIVYYENKCAKQISRPISKVKKGEEILVFE